MSIRISREIQATKRAKWLALVLFFFGPSHGSARGGSAVIVDDLLEGQFAHEEAAQVYGYYDLVASGDERAAETILWDPSTLKPLEGINRKHLLDNWKECDATVAAALGTWQTTEVVPLKSDSGKLQELRVTICYRSKRTTENLDLVTRTDIWRRVDPQKGQWKVIPACWVSLMGKSGPRQEVHSFTIEVDWTETAERVNPSKTWSFDCPAFPKIQLRGSWGGKGFFPTQMAPSWSRISGTTPNDASTPFLGKWKDAAWVNSIEVVGCSEASGVQRASGPVSKKKVIRVRVDWSRQFSVKES